MFLLWLSHSSSQLQVQLNNEKVMKKGLNNAGVKKNTLQLLYEKGNMTHLLDGQDTMHFKVLHFSLCSRMLQTLAVEINNCDRYRLI